MDTNERLNRRNQFGGARLQNGLRQNHSAVREPRPTKSASAVKSFIRVHSRFLFFALSAFFCGYSVLLCVIAKHLSRFGQKSFHDRIQVIAAPSQFDVG
jgi:hypothetical protein